MTSGRYELDPRDDEDVCPCDECLAARRGDDGGRWRFAWVGVLAILGFIGFWSAVLLGFGWVICTYDPAFCTW